MSDNFENQIVNPEATRAARERRQKLAVRVAQELFRQQQELTMYDNRIG